MCVHKYLMGFVYACVFLFQKFLKFQNLSHSRPSLEDLLIKVPLQNLLCLFAFQLSLLLHSFSAKNLREKSESFSLIIQQNYHKIHKQHSSHSLKRTSLLPRCLAFIRNQHTTNFMYISPHVLLRDPCSCLAAYFPINMPPYTRTLLMTMLNLNSFTFLLAFPSFILSFVICVFCTHTRQRFRLAQQKISQIPAIMQNKLSVYPSFPNIPLWIFSSVFYKSPLISTRCKSPDQYTPKYLCHCAI